MTTIRLSSDRSGATVSDEPPDPLLPDDGEMVCAYIGTRPVVVTRIDQKGVPLYNLHSPLGTRSYSEDQIRRWWGAVRSWSPCDKAKDMIEKAIRGGYDQESRAAGYDSPLAYALGLADGLGLTEPAVAGRAAA